MRMPLGTIILGLTMAMAGCSNKGLRDLQSNSTGPEEFMVSPVKPLTSPQDYAVLPPPTPGGGNLVDTHPNQDAIVALGGNPAALNATAVPAADGALVAQVSRYGVPANTREELAAEDAKFRKQQARWTRVRLFPVDRYEQAYRKQALDPYPIAERYRAAGAATPTAPPEYIK